MGRQGNKRRVAIGSASNLTADDARSEAKRLLASVALGNDPAKDRKHSREMPTLEDFCERYLSECAKQKLKTRTLVNYKIYLRKHTYPVLGRVKIDRISEAEIARLHRAIGKSMTSTANRVVECLSSVFRFAVECGVVPRGTNPCASIRAFKEVRRERFLSSSELHLLGETLHEAEIDGLPWRKRGRGNSTSGELPREKICPLAIAAIRLLLLTGARLREILHLKWDWVDHERGLLLLPDSKTGRKTIYLNAPALQLLTTIPRTSPYVFPSPQGDKPRADLNRPWRAVVRRSGLTALRLHDLRHTHASIGAGAGLGLPVIGKLLGHTQASTTNRYAHLDAHPLRAASDRIGSEIMNAIGQRSAGNYSAVRPLGQARRKYA